MGEAEIGRIVGVGGPRRGQAMWEIGGAGIDKAVTMETQMALVF